MRVRKKFAYAILLSLGIIFAYGLLWTYFISRIMPGPFQGMAIIMSAFWLIFMMVFIWKLFEPSMWTFGDMLRQLRNRNKETFRKTSTLVNVIILVVLVLMFVGPLLIMRLVYG